MIHLIEGPVGAGKSTYAARLGGAERAPRLILDDWMATLFRPDRPETGVIEWYLERKGRCLEQIWQVAADLVDAGSSVVLELGLIRRQDRADFYARVDGAGYALTVHVLEAPREVRQGRVRRRNRERGSTFAMDVPEDVFALADRLWEPPDEAECAERDIRFVATAP